MNLRGIILGALGLLTLSAAARCQEFLPNPAAPAPQRQDIAVLAGEYKSDMAPAVDAAPVEPEPPTVGPGTCDPPPCPDGTRPYQSVWGYVGARLFADAGRVAPNGVAYNPLFTLDLNINVWLWRKQGVYLYEEARFWGGRGGEAGQTQGNFDYTRREFDQTIGVAWNYYGPLELRAVGYDRENFNRGISLVTPGGTTNDGAGVEQRFYLDEEYTKLGQAGFDVSRAAFVSAGYFPTKSWIGGDGQQFKPGAFLRAYLTYDIPNTRCYLFGDFEQLFDKSSYQPRMLYSDLGLAFTYKTMPMLEFRVGSEFNTDWNASGSVRNMSLPYISLRLNF